LKYSWIVAAIGGVALLAGCPQASAQTSVTLHGMTEITVRYLTNDDAQNNSRLFMANGAIINSHVGLRGQEDLGAGLKAVFEIESKFDPQDGALSDSGRFFGSTANVGLSGPYGTVTAGRQNTPLFDKLMSTRKTTQA
jgi:predicted porin